MERMMPEELEPDPVKGKSTGVYVEKPFRPGKVFKLRDIQTNSKEVPRSSSAEREAREAGRLSPQPPRELSAERRSPKAPSQLLSRSGSPDRRLWTPEAAYRDASPLRHTATSSSELRQGHFVDMRHPRDFEERRHGHGPQLYEAFYDYGRMASREEVFEREPSKPTLEPSEDFKSWLRSALDNERKMVQEVLRGRHTEILGQLNAKLEDPPKPPKPPLQPVSVQLKEQSEPPAAPATLLGVLVVTEEWRPSRNGSKSDAKKVALTTDDTDAKSAGDDSRSHLSDDSGVLKRGASGAQSDVETKSRGNASMRMTHSIPHLRKNSLLEGLQAMPFWHPGRYVHTTQFDALFCGVILANTVVMALEMQYSGFQRGYELGFPHFTMAASDYWPSAANIFQALDILFGIIYTVELIVKLVGFKLRFFKDYWNVFDALLVTMWLVEISLRDVINLEPGILRMMRMCRLLRLIRLVKTIQGFDALYIMTTAMLGSTVCLFWSFMLLMTVQVMIAFFLNESLEIYFNDPSKPVSEKLEVFEYFGTTARVMLTMFELTLANWPVAARILQENVTEWYSIFSVAYKLIVGFAAVGIINGVFMQETFKVAASDDKLMMRQKERDRMLHTKKMKTLFEAADESGDGYIDREEFVEIMTIPEVRTWLAAQELPVHDPHVLFNLLDDGDAELTAEELVKGVERLKGTAKGIDLASFIAEYRSFAQKVAEKLDFELDMLTKKTDDEEEEEDG